ncbi:MULTISPECIES: flavin reductase family protein [unclassified Nocardia]|uniref:flavin reductase family protein n=1 Tax=unclassified Nocardia TaxID=2637762 RepID=UPI0034192788
MSDAPVDGPSAFESMVAMADAPVFIVTVAVGDERSGCLVGFASQVSIDPARFLVCLSKNNHTYRTATGAAYMSVHLVDRDNLALAQLFGAETGDEVDKFSRCRWRVGPNGVPVLVDAVAWFSGTIQARNDFGDHVGLVLAPEAGYAPGRTVDAVRWSSVADLEPGHPA